MKKWNFGFVMIGLAFLISILVLSCQTDETDEYSQQAVDVTAADLFIASEAYQTESLPGFPNRRDFIPKISTRLIFPHRN